MVRPDPSILVVARLASNPSSSTLIAIRSTPSHRLPLSSHPDPFRPKTNESPQTHRPTPQTRVTSKIPSVHVAHVVHGPSQAWARSPLRRTITIHRVIQPLLCVPWFPFHIRPSLCARCRSRNDSVTSLRFRDPPRLRSSSPPLVDLDVAYLYIFFLAWPRERQANIARLSLLFSLARLRLKRLIPVTFPSRVLGSSGSPFFYLPLPFELPPRSPRLSSLQSSEQIVASHNSNPRFRIQAPTTNHSPRSTVDAAPPPASTP